MNGIFTTWEHWEKRAGLAILGMVLFVGGASWQGLAADTAASTTQPATTIIASPALTGARDSYADVVKVVAPAVVTVRVEARPSVKTTQFEESDDFFRRFFGDRFEGLPRPMQPPQRRGLGSGVVASSDGYILTNHHVIDQADRIMVELLDGRTFEATLVGSDAPTDLAVIKIDATNLDALTLGDSDNVEIGDVVLAVGNPLGIGQTVTMGIISAKGRFTGGASDGSYEDFLQTDASINQGNSGGALVNTHGELVGINSQIVSTSGGNMGIGFAIPANMARHVMTELRTEGRVRRAQLGVIVQQVTSDMAESLGLSDVSGAIVSSVTEGSAAERGGIKQGDVIVSFNGQPLGDVNALRNRVAAAEPGGQATVGIIRDGRERSLTVALDEASASQKPAGGQPAVDDRAALGVAVAPLTPAVASQVGIAADVTGLLVQGVRPDSPADAAGIREGDVIREVDRTPVDSVEALRSAVNDSADRPMLLLVHRDGHDQFLTVRSRG